MEKSDLVIGIVKNNLDKVLLISRAKEEDFDENGILSITFPSGKIEPEEDIFTAVEREVVEETGYIVRAKNEIFSGLHEFSGISVTYIACEIDTFDRNHEKDPEVDKVLWVARTALLETVQTPINSAVLDYLGLNK